MIFIAHLTYYDEIENRSKNDKVALMANNFTEAVATIENLYIDTLRQINLLEPISDFNVIFLTTQIESEIRELDENGF